MNYDSQGPFIQLAAICERVIEGKDGTLSLIRIIDMWTSVAVGPETSTNLPPFDLFATFVLGLKAGAALGRFTYSLELCTPSGQRLALNTFDATFRGGQGEGVNIVSELRLPILEEGLHWLDVVQQVPEIEGSSTLLSRAPLQVVYQRAV